MKTSPIIIRKAKIEDSNFIAWAILTAVGIDNPSAEVLARQEEMLCRRCDVLYSWNNSLVAEIDGKVVGSLTCYDGTNYRPLRETTFLIIKEMIGKDFSDMDEETGIGEFYLDSMSVLPEFRGLGVGTALLRAGIAQAREMNLPVASLVVSPHKPAAQRLYESLGFKVIGEVNIFGEVYRKMVRH